MTKRFKKLLSALCIIALLVSSIATVFANGDPETEVSAAQEPVVEATMTENNETKEAAPAVEEAPAQETAPAVEEAPVQETAPVVQEAPVQGNAPAAEVAPAQEAAPAVDEAPVQEAAPVAEETPAQEPAPVVEVVPAQETAPVTDEAPAQESAPVVEVVSAQEAAPVAEETPAQKSAPVVEAVPVQEAAPVAEETPAQESANAVEEAPSQETTPAVEETPAQDAAPVTEEAPAQNNDADTEAAPAQDEAPAAETAPAQEDAPAVNAAPVQEDAPAADDDVQNNEETVADTDTTPADDYDELANEPVNYKEEDLVELEGAGYMDPEYLDEEIGEITPEVKYTNISEMKIGSTVSGSAGADEIFYYIKATRTQNIVLVLQENGNIQIRINEHDVHFIENEDGTKTYEMKVQSGSDYIIGISGNGSFRLTAEVKIVEETAEETVETIEEENVTAEEEDSNPAPESEASEEDIDNTETAAPAADAAEDDTEEDNAEAAEDNTEADSDMEAETENAENNEILTSEDETAEEGDEETEQTEVENTESAQETNEETLENNAPETTEDDEDAAEKSEPAVVTWVTAVVNEDGTVTVYANADIELDNQIVWQTRSADSDEWKKVGYGLKLTVEVTEENADNFFRFRLADGEYSPEYQIHVAVIDAAEETEEAVEENAEEAETAEETAEVSEGEEAVEETTDAEEEISSEETEDYMEETVSEESEEAAEETEESADEAEVSDNEEEAEDAESEEEAEEETEEAEETESLTEEQLTELGYRKIQIMNQNGTALYDSPTDEATVIGNAETGTELWIKDAEAEGWAEIYSEDEIQKFLKLAEIEKQLTFEEQMLADGYWRAQIALAEGTDLYNENAEVIAHLDPGTEIWVEISRYSEWARVYSEEEQEQFVKCNALIITAKPEGAEELVIRSVTATSSLEGVEVVYYGTPVTLDATLEGFLEDDIYTVQWKYSPDDGETYYDVENANELQYVYVADAETLTYSWKIVITLYPNE